MDYAAFATITHFVERSVKVCNHCSNKSRTEDRVTQFAICYNLVHDINYLTKELMIKHKREKGGRYKDESKIKAVGYLKNQTILQNVVERNKKIEHAFSNYCGLQEIHKDIAVAMSCEKEASFQAERECDYHEKVKQMRKKPRKPNQTEKKTRVHHTAATMNKPRFADVRKIHLDGIKAELEARGFTDYASMNFTQTRDKLKSIVTEEEGRDGNIKEEVQKTKHFFIKSTYDWSSFLGK